MVTMSSAENDIEGKQKFTSAAKAINLAIVIAQPPSFVRFSKIVVSVDFSNIKIREVDSDAGFLKPLKSGNSDLTYFSLQIE